jgi:hypothetical protein
MVGKEFRLDEHKYIYNKHLGDISRFSLCWHRRCVRDEESGLKRRD